MSWTFYHFMRHGGVRSLVKESTEMRREESSKHVIFSQVQSYCQFLNHSWPTIEIFIWNARNVKWLESRTVSNKTSWIAYNNIKRFYPLQKHSLPSLLQHGKCQSPKCLHFSFLWNQSLYISFDAIQIVQFFSGRDFRFCKHIVEMFYIIFQW